METPAENVVRKRTILVMGAAITALIAWDVYAESKGEENTISDILHNAGKKTMAIPFLAGCLMGHFFLGVTDHNP